MISLKESWQVAVNEDIIVEHHESSHYRSKYSEFEECRLLLRFRRRKSFLLPHENVRISGKAAFQWIIVCCVCERSVLSVDIPQDHRIRNKQSKTSYFKDLFFTEGWSIVPAQVMSSDAMLEPWASWLATASPPSPSPRQTGLVFTSKM